MASAKVKSKAKTSKRSAAKTRTKSTTHSKKKAKSKGKSGSKAKVSPIPPGYCTVTPHLTMKSCADAIEFYRKAFGAAELGRVGGPDGLIMHAAVRIGNSVVMMNDEFPGMGGPSPATLNGTSVVLHLYVKDADAWFARAVAAGARTIVPIQDMFWGDRYGIVADPFGHHWSIATRKEIVRMKDLPKRMAQSSKPEMAAA